MGGSWVVPGRLLGYFSCVFFRLLERGVTSYRARCVSGYRVIK